MSEEKLHELLRGMREDPIPVDSLARVRIGVTQRIRNGRRWLVLSALSIAAVSVSAFVIIFLPSAQPLHNNATVVARKSEPSLATKRQPTTKTLVLGKAHRRPASRRVAKPNGGLNDLYRESAGSTLIRFETADPNVLILVVEEK